MNEGGLMARKLAVTFVVAFAASLLAALPDALDLFEVMEWEGAYELVEAAFVAALAAGGRALVAGLFAFLPSDANVGANVAGKFAPEE